MMVSTMCSTSSWEGTEPASSSWWMMSAAGSSSDVRVDRLGGDLAARHRPLQHADDLDLLRLPEARLELERRAWDRGRPR